MKQFLVSIFISIAVLSIASTAMAGDVDLAQMILFQRDEHSTPLQ